MRRMSCPTISSIGLLERKRLFNFFTALHLLLATKDGGQRGSRAACCFFCFLGWISLTWIKLLVVVYVADERAPFSAGRDKAAQNVDIIVQRSVRRQLNIQQIWKAWHCSHKWWHQSSTRLSANGVEVPVFKSAPSRFPVSSTCLMCLPPTLQDTDNCRHVSVSALAKMGKIFYCIRWI